jgi:hypothetical protein
MTSGQLSGAARPSWNGWNDAADVFEDSIPVATGMTTLLESCSAFAAECERIVTMDNLARGVCALVAPFDYHEQPVAASAGAARQKPFTSPTGLRAGSNSISPADFCASIRSRFGRSHAAGRSAWCGSGGWNGIEAATINLRCQRAAAME